ncbi:MAG TPA: VOC family protein [Acidimicrobiia bacterium]
MKVATQTRANLILKTADMPGTIEWYRAAGFQVVDCQPEEDPTWCEVARDGTAIQFLAGETPWEGVPTLTGCVYVYPESVERAAQQIQGKIEAEWGIEEREWGPKELVLRDPNGYFITFRED